MKLSTQLKYKIEELKSIKKTHAMLTAIEEYNPSSVSHDKDILEYTDMKLIKTMLGMRALTKDMKITKLKKYIKLSDKFNTFKVEVSFEGDIDVYEMDGSYSNAYSVSYNELLESYEIDMKRYEELDA